MRIYAPCFEEPHTATGKILVCWFDTDTESGEIWYSLEKAAELTPALFGAE